MTSSQIVELNKANIELLQKTLLAEMPNEGCALLIGHQHIHDSSKDAIRLKIDIIWPCSNIWKPGIFDNSFEKNKTHVSDMISCSKKNRFAINPMDHLLAQKWARSHKSKILGTAHSHPCGEAIPSILDISLTLCPNLMLITDRFGKIRAWWIDSNRQFQELELVS